MKMTFPGACASLTAVSALMISGCLLGSSPAQAFQYATGGIQDLPTPALEHADALESTQASSLGAASHEDGGLFTPPEQRSGQPALTPSVGIEWFSVESAERGGRRARATWMGPRANIDARVHSMPVVDFGVKGSAFRSAAPLTTDARNGAVTELEGMGYASFHPNSERFGKPTLGLSLGYSQNRRRVEGGYALVSAVRGLKYGADLSFTLERSFNIGLNASMNDAINGVAEYGAFLTQRISNDGLRARVGFSMSRAKEIFPTETLRETWSEVSFALIATL